MLMLIKLLVFSHQFLKITEISAKTVFYAPSEVKIVQDLIRTKMQENFDLKNNSNTNQIVQSNRRDKRYDRYYDASTPFTESPYSYDTFQNK
jgi:hypothetical protein